MGRKSTAYRKAQNAGKTFPVADEEALEIMLGLMDELDPQWRYDLDHYRHLRGLIVGAADFARAFVDRVPKDK